MASIVFGSTRDPEESLGSNHGLWWVSGSQSKVQGIVEFLDDNSARLMVMDQLAPHEQRSDLVVHGRLRNGSRVTLDRARVVTTAGRSLLRRGWDAAQPQVWESSGYFRGALLDQPREEQFTTIAFTTPMLEKWVTPPDSDHSPEFSDPNTLSAVVLRAEIPPELSIRVERVGTIKLRFFDGMSNRHEPAELRADLEPYWMIELDRARSASDIYTNVLMPMLLWTTFCVGAGDRFTRVGLSSGEGPLDRNDRDMGGIDWYPYGWSKAGGVSRKHLRSQQTIAYESATDRLGPLMQSWFDLYKEAGGSLVDANLELLRGRSRFAGDDFVITMRAAEGYHRKTAKMTRLPAEEWDALSARLLAQAETDGQRSLVEAVFGYANNPSLATRINDLTSSASPMVRHIANGQNRALKRAVSLRNFYAHGREVWPKSYREMYAAKVVIEYLIRSSILQRLGISPSETDEWLSRSYDWDLMEQLLPDAPPR